jgi:hypothetical protein
MKKRYRDGGVINNNVMRVEPEDAPVTVTGRRFGSFNLADLGLPSGGGMGPSMPGDGGGGMPAPTTSSAPAPAPVQSRRQMPIARTAGYVGPTVRGDNFQVSAGAGRQGSLGVGSRFAFKEGGKVKKMAKGGTASKRADGCATKGKTKGRFV